MSDAKLQAKVALQQAGVIGAPAASPPKAEERPDGKPATRANGTTTPTPAPTTAAEHQAAANLARDARAARDAPTAVVANGETPVARALQEPETRVSNEGENLLKGPRAE